MLLNTDRDQHFKIVDYWLQQLEAYLSRLFARCLEFGLLAGFFYLLVLGEAVGVLGARRVVLLSQDLPARRECKGGLERFLMQSVEAARSSFNH